jgi:uncharacterized membrane protein YcaP (DUF421 family)
MPSSYMSAIQPMLWVAAHTLVIYFFLIFLIRTIGRRTLGQLSVIDLVIIIVMGSAVETAMVNGDTSLQAGLVCAATLLVANRTLAFLVFRSRRLRKFVVGNPMILVHDGKFLEDHLRRAGLTQDDVMEALREREENHLEDIHFAILEVDGTINVVPCSAETRRTNRDVREIKVTGQDAAASSSS